MTSPPVTPHQPYGLMVAIFTGFVGCCYGFGVYLFGTVAPDMRADLDLGPEAIGLASGSAQVGLLASGLLAGLLAHRIGYFRLVLIAQGLSALCLMLVAACTTRTALVVLLTLLGGATSAVWVPMVPLAGSVVPAGRRGIALGIMAAGTSYGVLLNGTFAAAIVSQFGWRAVWVAASAVSVVPLAAALVLLRPLLAVGAGHGARSLDEDASPSSTASAGALALLRDPTALKAMLITAVNGLAFLPFQTYLTSFFRDGHGWSSQAATGLWSAIGLGGLAGGLAFGALADAMGAQRSLVVAYALLLAASLVVTLADGPIPVFAAALLFGLAYSGIFELMATYVTKSFASAAAGRLIGMTLVALGSGSAVGNYAGGILVARGGGYPELYGALAVLVAGNVALSAALPSDRGRRAKALSGLADRDR